jgi:hypothetical protein
MMTCLAVVMALAASACAQYTIDDQGGFVMNNIPQKGEDFSSTVQAALEWCFDPRRVPRLPGYFHFRVTKALVYASDPFVPRPDTSSSDIHFHMHAIVILPSGQRIEEDSVEMIDGIWIRKKFHLINFGDQVMPYNALAKDGAAQFYADLLRPVPGPGTDPATFASFIVLLGAMPIQASGSVDIQYWQRIHDLALTRHDLLKDQP